MNRTVYRKGQWMHVHKQGKFYPLDPRPEEIQIEDIARGLSRICRYAGHCSKFYSVAEHSILVSKYVPEQYALAGLLHDASEAYIGDMICPLKYEPEMVGFRIAEENLQRCIYERFGIGKSDEQQNAIDEIDTRIIIDEANAMMPNPPDEWPRQMGLEPLGIKFASYAFLSEEIEILFLRRFEQLTK